MWSINVYSGYPWCSLTHAQCGWLRGEARAWLDQGKAASSSRLLASDWSRTLHAGLWLAEVPVTVSGGSGGWMSRAEAAAGASLVPPSAKCQPQSQARHHRPQQVCHHHHQGGHRYHYQWSKCYYHVSSGGVNYHEKPNIWTRHR